MDNNIAEHQEHKPGAYREAVGLFEDIEDLQDAVRELEGTAFPRDAISVLGTRKEIEEKFGMSTVNPDVAEDDPDSPRQPPVRPEEKTVGAGALVGCAAYIGAISLTLISAPLTLASTLVAVAIGGGSGAALGAILVKLIRQHLNKNIADQVGKGGLLLWVRTPDEERENIACNILQHHGAKHIKVHDID
ncbi:MAG: hypothetical protein ACXW30_05030 [Micavibrio sp.]